MPIHLHVHVVYYQTCILSLTEFAKSFFSPGGPWRKSTGPY